MPDQTSTSGSLPAPTGPYRVGRVAYHWREAAVDATASPPAPEPRESMVWIWYPAAPAADAAPAPYLPPGWEPVGQFWGFETAGAASHAVEDAPVASDRARHPVLVFSPSGFPPFLLSSVLQELASHGYVVVGINHTRETTVTVFPDGRVVPMDAAWMQPALGPFSGEPEPTMRARAAIAEAKTADVRFVVDQVAALNTGTGSLAGHLDLDSLGAFGHSLGGNAALELARLDPRCKAAANLDGGVWSEVGKVGLERPALTIMADHPEMQMPCESLVQMGAYPSIEWCQVERGLTVGGWQTTYARARPGYAISIRGSGHVSFMDVPFLPVTPGSMMAGGLAVVRLDPHRAWRIICDYLLAFFGRYLQGASAPLLDGPSPAHPEAAFGPPRDLLSGQPHTSN